LPALPTRLTVAEWNLHWGVTRTRGRDRAKHFDVVAALPDEVAAADLLVLPEAWRWHDERGSFLDNLRDLGFGHIVESRFVTLDLGGPHRRVAQPGDGWWELAVASRHPIVEAREIALAQSIDDTVPTRRAIACEVDVAGASVDLVAFHVSSKLWWGAPVMQLTGLRRALRASGIDGSRRPAVLAGDANLWRSALPTVLPGWRSTVRGATFPSWRAHSQIDHVLIRGDIDHVGGGVSPYNATSDHLAIWAQLAIR
jgi:endonuclease/exonuclease/phosphatase family metal-dependent hydrolase